MSAITNANINNEISRDVSLRLTAIARARGRDIDAITEAKEIANTIKGQNWRTMALSEIAVEGIIKKGYANLDETRNCILNVGGASYLNPFCLGDRTIIRIVALNCAKSDNPDASTKARTIAGWTVDLKARSKLYEEIAIAETK